MTLDEKKTALNYIYMLVECSGNDGDPEYFEAEALAKVLVDALEKQNDDAILHRDITRSAKEQYPHLSLAQARKAATRAIKAAEEKRSN